MKTKKKLIYFITSLFFIIFMLLICNTTYAADSFGIESVDITAPETGIYEEGQEVEITFTFSQPIKGTLPKYTIYFDDNFENQSELNEIELTDFSAKATYKYTIKSGDNGEIKPGNFIDTANYKVQTEDGTEYFLSSPFMNNFETKIYADTTIEWTNFENAKPEIISDSQFKTNFKILIQDVSLNERNIYYFHLSNNSNEKIIFKGTDDIKNDNEKDYADQTWIGTLNTVNNQLYFDNFDYTSIFDKDGEVYLTICEEDFDTGLPKILLENYKLERLPMEDLTKRINAYFLDDSTSVFCYELYGESARNINYRIGRVTDMQLLQKIKDGDASAFEELLEYAKNNDSIFEGTVSTEGKSESILNDLNLIDDAYYYIYLEVDTENGEYRQIEDIALCQGRVTQNTKFLYNLTDPAFEWNLDDNGNNLNNNQSENKEDPTVSPSGRLPYAGRNIIILISIVSTIVVSIVLYKKYKLYKLIK